MSGNRLARGTFGLTSTGFAGLIYSICSKHILGEINLYRDNAWASPFVVLMWF